MLVVAGTLNPSKIEGIRRAFTRVFGGAEVLGVNVEGLKPQPIGIDEIVEGARKRALYASSRRDADFAVGIEAGIIPIGGHNLDFQAAYIISRTGEESVGFSPGFPLPQRFVEPLYRGVYSELEEVANRYFGTENIGERGGVIRLLSRGRVTREDLSYYATLMALIPFENRELYFTP